MQEVIARGAKVLLITNKSKDEVISENIWEKIEVENTNDDLLPGEKLYKENILDESVQKWWKKLAGITDAG